MTVAATSRRLTQVTLPLVGQKRTSVYLH